MHASAALRALSSPLAVVILCTTAHASAGEQRSGASVAVHVAASSSSLTLWQQTADPVWSAGRRRHLIRPAEFTPICAHSPCDIDVTPGLHVFGLSRDGGAILKSGNFLVTRPARINVTYHDHSSTRRWGYVPLVASLLGGIAILAFAPRDASRGGAEPDPVWSAFGGMVLAAGVFGSAGLFAVRDGVSVSVSPLAAPFAALREGEGRALTGGAQFELRF